MASVLFADYVYKERVWSIYTDACAPLFFQAAAHAHRFTDWSHALYIDIHICVYIYIYVCIYAYSFEYISGSG